MAMYTGANVMAGLPGRTGRVPRISAAVFMVALSVSMGGQSALAANLWPGNTATALCGGFINQDTGYGGSIIAPDGTNTGQLVFEANPGSGLIPHFEYIFSDLGAGQQTLSFHFKAGANSWAYIQSQVAGTTQRVWFNLVGNGAVGANVPAGWIAQITPVANGWYRSSVTFTVPAGQSAIFNGFGL